MFLDVKEHSGGKIKKNLIDGTWLSLVLFAYWLVEVLTIFYFDIGLAHFGVYP